MRYLDLGPVLTGRTTDRSHVEFYMTEASSLNSVWAQKNAVIASAWHKSQQLFSVFVSAKKTFCLTWHLQIIS